MEAAAAEEEAEAVQAWEGVVAEVVVVEQALVEEEERALVVEEGVGEGEELRSSHYRFDVSAGEIFKNRRTRWRRYDGVNEE